MKITTSTIEIDLTKLKSLVGTLIPGEDVELKLIELYQMVPDENYTPIEVFTKYLLKKLFLDDKEHEYDDINIFFKEKVYMHTVLYFIDILEIYLLSKLEPDIFNIKFSKYIKNTTDELLVEFVVYKGTVDD